MSNKYEVEVTQRVLKDLSKLRDKRETIVREIASLENDPYKGHTLSGTLKGARALEMSSGGVAYRAAYFVREDTHACLVFMVGPHEGFYARAESRAKALKRSGVWGGSS